MRHVTTIHAGGVGDLVSALPAMRAVRRKWASARITLLGRPERAALAVLAGVADATADIETAGLWRLMGHGPAGTSSPPAPLAEADLVIDFFSGGRLAEALPKVPVKTVPPLPHAGVSDSAAAWLLDETRRRLALPEVSPQPEMAVPAEAAASALQAAGLGPGGGRVATLHAGSGSPRKNWPPDRFEALAARLRRDGLRIVWIIGPAEQERGAHSKAAPEDVMLQGVPLVQVAALLSAATVHVGNDSGVTHVAAATRGARGRPTPTVALFGPSDARVWAPRGRHVCLVRSPTGAMDGLEVKTVWQAVRPLLGEPPGRSR